MLDEPSTLEPQLRPEIRQGNIDGRSWASDESQSTSSVPPKQRWQHHQQWPTSHSPNDALAYNSEWTSTCERTTSIDVIAQRLSRQHLRLDAHSLPPSAQVTISTCSLTTHCLPLAGAELNLNSSNPEPSSSAGNRPRVSPATSPAMDPWEITGKGARELPRQRLSAPHEANQLRLKSSSRFHNTLRTTWAMQTLVEGMIGARTQCNVRATPSVTTVGSDPVDLNEMDLDPASLEVDEDPADGGGGLEEVFLDKCVEARRASGPFGIRKNGFPLHRSSTETALRCQNLVRNKPRMRKRTKLRDKSNMPAMSVAIGTAVTFTSTHS